MEQIPVTQHPQQLLLEILNNQKKLQQQQQQSYYLLLQLHREVERMNHLLARTGSTNIYKLQYFQQPPQNQQPQQQREDEGNQCMFLDFFIVHLLLKMKVEEGEEV